MKTLKDYIHESLLDVNFADNNTIDAKKDIINFIKDNYKINIANIKISEEPDKDGLYVVNCAGGADAEKQIKSLTNDLFKWGYIGFNFGCVGCSKLTSLKGAPMVVGSVFNCSYCNSLKTLDGAPFECRDFYCSHCDSLKSLEGSPEEVKCVFDCSCCDSLKSLEGSPKKCKYFSCKQCCNLTSLKGAPEKISGDFSCIGCSKLTSLKGIPENGNYKVYCKGCDNISTKEYEKYNVVDN